MQYNKLLFQPGDQITLVLISPIKHKTVRIELTIVAFDRQKQQYSYRRKGKNPLQYLPKEKKLYNKLLFKGHDLAFTLDSETNHWDRNKYYHFVTDDPTELRSFLTQHCLTLTNRNKTKIAYRHLHPEERDLRLCRLYTDDQIRQDDIIDDDCPFEV